MKTTIVIVIWIIQIIFFTLKLADIGLVRHWNWHTIFLPLLIPIYVICIAWYIKEWIWAIESFNQIKRS